MNEELKKKLNTLSPQQLKALMEKLGKEKKELPKMVRNPENRYPLTSAQKRMWFLSKLDPDSFLYTNPMAVRLKTNAPLELTLYTESFEQITQRHEIMRTSFSSQNGQIFQTIHADVPVNIHRADLRSFTSDEQKSIIEEILSKDGQTTIDVEAFPLFRHSILQLSDLEYVFIYTSHHIISDAWSSSTLFRQVLQLYSDLKNNKPVNQEQLKYQFIDYVNWENNWLQSPEYAKTFANWKSLISRDPEPLKLPFDYVPPAIINYEGGLEKVTLNAALVSKLSNFSKHENVNLFHTLLAVFNVLLYKYSGNEDIVVGIPLANRNVKEFQETLGLFLNTLPHKTTVDADVSFRNYLAQVKNVSQVVILNQELPFEKLIEELKPSRNLAVSPVFQVLFVYQNIPSLYEWGGIKLSPEKADYKISKYPLNLWLEDVGEELYLSMAYQTALFKPSTIKNFLKQYEFLLNEAVSKPETSIAELCVEEKRTLELSVSPFTGDTWVDAFERQVVSNPSKPAVKYLDKQLTYAKLNSKANKIAHYLLATRKIQNNTIAFMLDRSEVLLSTILAINKIGAAYLPIDVNVPQQRLDYMVQDAGIDFIVTQSKYASRFDRDKIQLLLLDEQKEELENQEDSNPGIAINVTELVYVIYTSGSTGTPKGVCIEHRNLVNYSKAVWERISLDTDTTFATVSSIHTDLGNTQIFPPLMHGAAVNIIPDDYVTNAQQLAAYISGNKIDCLKITPSLLSGLLNVTGSDSLLPEKILILGGEKVSPELVKKIRSIRKQLRILNHYGPTETTVGVLTHEIQDVADNSVIPLGKSFGDNFVFIADKNNRAQPDGMPGEIIVCGNNVGRGYNNNEALTNTVFVESVAFPGCRCYKTGDKGRKLEDGTIEYLGRIDRQLKIRGYRVEPDGIEKVILKNKAVAEAAVISQKENSLTAFVIVAFGQELNEQMLKQELKTVLPEYMVPSEIIALETFPRLGNGKLDMQKLKELETGHSVSPADTIAIPRDETELVLSHIWKEVIKINSVSITDNFFDVGGNSLIAIELIGKINNRFSTNLSIAVLFEHNTIALMASLIRSSSILHRTSPLVLLKKGTVETTVFFVHPAGGDILCYYELAQNIAGDCTVYGLQSAISEKGDVSVKAMASRYLEEIRKQQFNGNYIFAGWSMGALVAYEMALQLKETENKYAKVIILDQKAPELNVHQPYNTSITQLERLAVFAGKVEQLVGRKINITIETLENLSTEEQSELFLKEFKKHNLIPEDIAAKDFYGFLEKMILHNEITMDYIAEKYDGPVLLVKANDSKVVTSDEKESCYGWNQYAENIQIGSVSGNHVTMMKQPNVQSVAETINKTINNSITVSVS